MVVVVVFFLVGCCTRRRLKPDQQAMRETQQTNPRDQYAQSRRGVVLPTLFFHGGVMFVQQGHGYIIDFGGTVVFVGAVFPFEGFEEIITTHGTGVLCCWWCCWWWWWWWHMNHV